MESKELSDFLTSYIFLDDKPERADVIFVPGNGYPQMAERAAKLYREGFARKVLPSGRYSITAGHFQGVLCNKKKYSGSYETEWEFLRDVLIKNGVDGKDILREDSATYTYENALRSKEVLEKEGLHPVRAILCCKNYHARRALSYYRRVFPEVSFIVQGVCVDGITGENWTETQKGIDEVMAEAGRMISQFSLLMK